MTPEQMQKIVEGAPEWAHEYCLKDSSYIDYTDENTEWCDHCFKIADIRTELAKREPMDLRDVDIPHGTIVLEK